MAKRKKKKRKRIPQRRVFVSEEETGSSPSPRPDVTLTPDVSLETPTGSQLLSRDSTNAPKVGEKAEEEEQYAESQAALIDKYILSRHSIPFLLALGVIGYLFIQDNAAGKLVSWKGIWWTIQKSGILLVIFFIVLFCQFLYNKISGRKS